MKKPLTQLASLSTGYSFRGSVPVKHDGQILVVQAGDISENGTVNFREVDRVDQKDIAQKALLANGDILVVSRGTGLGSFRAAVFDSQIPAIASVTLHVIRIKDESITPEYLCAYLNSHHGQAMLASLATGSSVKMLSLNELKMLKIPVPSEEKQATFSQLTTNIQKQSELLAQKADLLQKLYRLATSSISQ